MLERHAAGRLIGQGITIPRDHIEVRPPGVIVERLEVAHQVGGDGHVGRDGLDGAVLAQVTLQDSVVLEAVVIEQHGLVALLAVGGGRLDLVPSIDLVTPKGRVPSAVHRLDGAIARLQPFAKTLGAQVAIAFVAVLVADVPGRQRRVILVTFGQPPR